MPVAANGISGKGRTLSNSPKKSEFPSNVKRSSSSEYSYFFQLSIVFHYFTMSNFHGCTLSVENNCFDCSALSCHKNVLIFLFYMNKFFIILFTFLA